MILPLTLLLKAAFAQGLWEARAPYPIQATEVSAATLNGKIYALCGILPNGSRTTTLYIYDPYRDEWSTGAPVPIPGGGDHCNVAAANGRLYVLGSIQVGTSVVDANTYEYDPAANRWTTVGRMTQPRGASGVAVINNRIYVAGGLSGISSVSAFEAFDVQTRQWTRLPNMPTARDHLTAQSMNGKFYAIAGRVGATNLRANEEYDPATNSWRSREGIPTPRGGLGSGTLRGRIQVFGGEGPSGRPQQTFQENEEYDPATDRWGTLAIMTTPRHGLYGATFEGRIFAPSGGPQIGGTFSNVHEVFYLPPEAPPTVSGLLNSASYRRELAPGAIVALFGSNLSQGERIAARFPIPTSLNATTVRVNGTAVPLLYTGPNQINFQLPYNLVPGPINVTVNNVTSLSTTFEGPDATSVAPGIYALGGNGEGQGAVLVAGTGLIARATRDAFSRAARRGELVEIYCTGLGRLDFPPLPGQPAPSTPPPQTTETPRVSIGGADAEVSFSGLTPGALGLYQINARVGATAQTGIAVPVTVTIGGRAGNTVTIAVIE